MLEMDTNDTVDLTSHEFNQYVRNQWGWQGRFLQTNAVYSATAASLNNS
jgi:hypothetical protein